jgi:phenylalanyl-tRNA synthetase beta chain
MQEYVQTSKTADEIAAILTSAGIEVDHVEPIASVFSGVVAALVESTEPLESGAVLAKIFDGKERYQVVCAASNCRPGLITAYAPVGASLDGKNSVKMAVVRGKESPGFLCSEKELGLSEYNEGVVELTSDVKPGTLLKDIFSDVVFDITLTPNLGHCMSVLGVSRELAAFLGTSIQKKSIPTLEKKKGTLKVVIEQNTPCARYSGLFVEDIAVRPSDTMMRVRLERSGIRSINNIVDITNYIGQELGQPLHAFDADSVADHALVVRNSKQQESLVFLDDVSRLLPEESVVIADSKKALAAGGVMGGKDSCVNEKTTKIIFESAYFTPQVIRKTSKRLGVQTDASKRFERGADQNNTLFALEYAYSLLGKTCPNEKVVALCDEGTEKAVKSLTCRLSRASKILGYEVSVDEVESAFSRLCLPASWDGQDLFTVRIPSYRHDLTQEVDLIEEIGRLVGLQYEAAPKPKYATSPQVNNPLFAFTREVRSRLLALGLQEFLCCDLISPEMAKIVPVAPEAIVNVMNPLSVEQSVLRPSLLPGLLDSLKRNFSQRIFDIHAFEIGHGHIKREQEGKTLYNEPLLFALVLAGKAQPHHYLQQDRLVDFYDIKGVLENFFDTLRFTGVEFKKSDFSLLHPGRQAKIYVQGVHVGMVGELHPTLLRKLDIEAPVLFAECDLDELLRLSRKEVKMHELTLFPSSDRDWTITLSKAISFDALISEINAIKPALLEEVSLQALFEHEKLGVDKHNVTLHFVYRDRQKTVSQEEVDTAHSKLVETVSRKFS